MRVSPGNLLANTRRQRLLALVRDHPGLCFRELVRRSGVASGTLAYHLHKLVRFGLVWEQRLGPRILHFAGVRPPELAVMGAVEEHGLDALDHLLLALLAGGTRGQTQIIESPATAQVPPSTVQHHLYRLRRYGFVTERRVGRHVYYEPVTVQAWPDTPTPVQLAEVAA